MIKYLGKYFLLLLVALFSTSAIGQGKPSLKKADKYFEKNYYEEAAKQYKRLERGKRTDPYIYLQLAACYQKLDRVIEASKYYGKAIAASPQVDAQIYYQYAKILQKSGRYEVARDMMDDFSALVPNDSKAKDFLRNPDAYYDLYKLPELFYFAEIGFNDRFYDDYGAVLNSNDTLYFISNRTKHEKKIPRKLFEVKDKTKGRPNYDIYQASFKTPLEPIFMATRLKGTINKRFNDGTVVQVPGQKTMYFSSDSYRYRRYRKIKEVKKRDGISNLFVAQLKNKKWRKVKKLPFTQGQYTYRSPALSADGQYLYFASNMPGSYGELDLWKVALLQDNEYGEPENLGPVINSGTINDYPFVDQDGVLYFSSDRWGGYGGMDIYKYDERQSNAQVINLGAPLNTAMDEYAFSFYPDKKAGLFSSNRIGRNDIYKALPVCEVEMQIKVVNKKFNQPVAYAQVEYINSRRNLEAEKLTNAQGIANAFIVCTGKMKISVSHPDYLDQVIEFDLPDDPSKEALVVELVPLEELLIEQDRVVLDAIHFAFDQKEITLESKFELDKLVKVMKRYTDMRIKVASHTDSKGRAAYNLKLSQERAHATVEYLISKGIAPERLEYQGYGSEQLKIKCSPCDPAQDAQNRRSEFIILAQ